ncbi:MAG: hypothetical protein ACM3MD_04670 [Betaproteobacteria bacterium]
MTIPRIPMPIDKTIFGLSFRPNEALQPTREELKAFLESPKKEGRRILHGDDLAKYRELLNGVHAFERRQPHVAAHQDIQGKMFYGVLGHSHFVKPALKSAVEQYKYHVYALRTLDFNKPTAFIKSAEEAMGRLNPKRKEDAVKLARLQGMIEERKKTLRIYRKRWAALTEELTRIAVYVRDNLVKIEALCEASVGVLADLHRNQKKERQITEDLKTHFKEHLKDRLRHGPITKQYLETVKHDVAVLSKEISSLLSEEVAAVTKLYEAIQDHAKKIAGEIDALTAKIEIKKDRRPEDDQELFTEIEQVLVSLVSDYHFELKKIEVRTETTHENLFLEKKKEMLDILLELLQEERRSWTDRRSTGNRRIVHDPNYEGHPRRSGKDRRAAKDRRKPVDLSLRAIT